MIPVAERVPPETIDACAVAMTATQVYMFGGKTPYGYTNELWELTVMDQYKFTWQKIEYKDKEQKPPSPRVGAVAWGHGNKLWTFSGAGPSPKGYLSRYGKWLCRCRPFAGLTLTEIYVCNQLNSYNSSLEKWENVECFGTVPAPRCESAVTNIDNAVWLYGGTECYHSDQDGREAIEDGLYVLNMKNLTWTQLNINKGAHQPEPRFQHTLTAVSESQLILHGGQQHTIVDIESNLWIFDTASMSWRKDINLQVPARSMHSIFCRKE